MKLYGMATTLPILLLLSQQANGWIFGNDVCDPNPCVFDGNCRASGGSFSCSCPGGVSPCSDAVMRVFKRYNFQRHGRSERIVALFNPVVAIRFRSIYDSTTQELRNLGIPGRHNGKQDAMRHALVSYRWTKRHGASLAKKFTDAHERSNPNPFKEQAMDLHNNAMGRDLAENSANTGRDDLQVITEAYNNGLLQRAPLSTHPSKVDVV